MQQGPPGDTQNLVDPFELRGDPRIGTDVPAALYTSDFSGALEARTRDLSVGGCCVVTASPFAHKSVRRIRLMLPDGALEVDAEGRWQQALDGDDMVMTGVSFYQPPDEVVDRLWDVVLDGGKKLARFLYTGSELRTIGVDGALGLAQISRMRDVRAGQTIYRQGEERGRQCSIFVIERGEVSLSIRVRGVRDIVVDRIGPGSVFGGLPILAGTPALETVVTETDVRMLELDDRALRYLGRAKPWLARTMSEIVTAAYVKRLHRFLERIEDRL